MANKSWIISGDDGWVAKQLKGMIAKQGPIIARFPEAERQSGYGFACRLIVNGEGGGAFDLWFCEHGLQPKPDGIALRNIVTTDEDTIFDLWTPDVSSVRAVKGGVDVKGIEALEILARRDPGGILSQIVPRLTLRQAIALGLFQFAGDMPDIDSEMWCKIFDKVVKKLSFPIVVESLIIVANQRKRG